ncbi:hypothetical protein Y1Q_0018035 [Alligator mississippiensis]|uniref:Uncharacterized protein n=1 Tax=Alligator mississippiensis TaxID=8496 RepID=A0A151MYC5_ALLMI|nr:hypothetical protein Y1Q_0018035 [Alligator mississippiensis]
MAPAPPLRPAGRGLQPVPEWEPGGAGSARLPERGAERGAARQDGPGRGTYKRWLIAWQTVKQIPDE